MFIHRSASVVRILTPGKVNLFFEVLAKRPDGYHDIETLMLPIGLWDTLEFSANTSGQVTLDCRWAELATPDLPPLPQRAENLVVRAVELLRQRAGIEAGADIQLLKRIPMAAGLGGGSSDLAAALLAANLAWNLDWPRERLAALAGELGSDAPFFFAQGPAICRGRGERVEPVVGLAPLWLVLVKPDEGLSTPAVYRACRVAERPRCVQDMVEALRCGDWSRCRAALANGLQPAAAMLSPWPARLQAEFERVGCVAHQMSGSGTAYFGICRHAVQARTIAARLRARNVGRVFVVNTLSATS